MRLYSFKNELSQKKTTYFCKNMILSVIRNSQKAYFEMHE